MTIAQYEVIAGWIYEEPEIFDTYEDALELYRNFEEMGIYVALRKVQVEYLHTHFEK